MKWIFCYDYDIKGLDNNAAMVGVFFYASIVLGSIVRFEIMEVIIRKWSYKRTKLKLKLM
jgi:hypothetical protein